MASRGYPTNILDQTTEVLAACQQIDPDLRAGSFTQAALSDALIDARKYQSQLMALEMQLTDLRNKRDVQLTEMWDAIKRVRATVKGIYGDDSPQYDLVGGTRKSERKRRSRRQPA